MREVKEKSEFQFLTKASRRMDRLVGVFLPKSAYRRIAFRQAYEAIDKHRTRKKRDITGGTGDSLLDRHTLDDLRETSRDIMRNNPLVKGLLKTERNGVVGTGVTIQARTGDTGLNAELEAAWKEDMLDRTCDVTGRLNFNQLLRLLYYTSRRDGDAAVIYTDDGLQAVEGEQIGTPYGKDAPKHYDVINGVAYSKQTKRVIGYYIGKAHQRWGYIEPGSFKKYKAENVHHYFSPERFSHSRGEPALASAIKYIDYISEYYDAELVAAKVNACFSVFVSRKEAQTPAAYTDGSSSTGQDEHGQRLEKIAPGIIMYGEEGEEARGIGQTRPGEQFDPFLKRGLSFIGRPLCMPLMLITLDFSGATFMNARFAYNEARDNWEIEQEELKAFSSRSYRWWAAKKKEFNKRGNIFRHEVFCKRWPYVDPFKESKADEQDLKNKTNTRTLICRRRGLDAKDVIEQLGEEEKHIEKAGVTVKEKTNEDKENGQKGAA